MTRRSLVIFLHWSVVLLILTMVKDGVSAPWVLVLFAGFVALWSTITLVKGLRAHPGLKLSPALRHAYPWLRRSLHILLALTAVTIVFRLIGKPLWFLDAWTMLLITFGAGTFHGLFHFWQHTALYDNALKPFLPRLMHSVL
jgi:cytochrome b561